MSSVSIETANPESMPRGHAKGRLGDKAAMDRYAAATLARPRALRAEDDWQRWAPHASNVYPNDELHRGVEAFNGARYGPTSSDPERLRREAKHETDCRPAHRRFRGHGGRDRVSTAARLGRSRPAAEPHPRPTPVASSPDLQRIQSTNA